MSQKRIVVMISGNGSNLQAIIDAIERKELAGEIALVVSNKAKAFGLERASKAGIPTIVKTLKSYKDKGRTRLDYDLDLAKDIKEFLNGEPDLQILAGFMHILSAEYLAEFSCPIINLHPALPGEFDGAHAIERAFKAFKDGEIKHTGVMVHKVIPLVDRGEVIIKEIVEIKENDTLQDLENRIHAIEHNLLVQAAIKILA